MIAPIAITVVFVLYLAVYVSVVTAVSRSVLVLVLLGIPMGILGIGMVFTLMERIREIRKGEEDDLDNY